MDFVDESHKSKSISRQLRSNYQALSDSEIPLERKRRRNKAQLDPPCQVTKKSDTKKSPPKSENFHMENVQYKSIMEKLDTVISKAESTQQSIDKLNRDMSSIVEKIRSLESSQSSILSRLSEAEKSIVSVNKDIRTIQNANNRYSELSKITNEMIQKSLSTSMTITGLPLLHKRDMIALIDRLNSYLSIDLNINCFSQIYPVKQRNNHQSNVKMKFISEMTKSIFTDAIKAKRMQIGRNTPMLNEDLFTDLAIDDISRGKEFYFRSDLSPQNRELFKKARELRNHFQFVWEKNGNIFIKPNVNAPAVKITCIEDLDRIRQTSSNAMNDQ